MAQKTENHTWKRSLARLGLGIFGFLFVFGFIGGIYLSFQATGKLPPRPDRILDDWMAEQNLTAPVAITILRGLNRGEVDLLYEKSWPKDLPSDTTFPLGELVEPFVAQAILILHDQGSLDLDEPVATYLPELPPKQGKATVSAYLNYTALVEDLVSEKPSFERSQRNYRILSQVIEAVVAMPNQEFITQKVVEKLELKHTRYQADGETPGWYTTQQDLTTWAKVLNSNRLVKMRTQLRAQTPPTLENDDKWWYGYGWRFEPWKGFRLMEATGFETNSSYAILRLPQKNFTILILSQVPRTDFDPLAAGREIGRIYLEREFPKNFRFGDQAREISSATH